MMLPTEMLQEMEALDTESMRLNALFEYCRERGMQAATSADQVRWTRRFYKVQNQMVRQQALNDRMMARVDAYHTENCPNCTAHKDAFEWRPAKSSVSEPLPN